MRNYVSPLFPLWILREGTLFEPVRYDLTELCGWIYPDPNDPYSEPFKAQVQNLEEVKYTQTFVQNMRRSLEKEIENKNGELKQLWSQTYTLHDRCSHTNSKKSELLLGTYVVCDDCGLKDFIE